MECVSKERPYADWSDCKIEEHVRVYQSILDTYQGVLNGLLEELRMRKKAKYEASK